MLAIKPIITKLLKQLLIVFALYTVFRILFYWFNKNYFQGLETIEFFKILFFGLRFDAFSIAVFNSLFILLSLLPFQFSVTPIYQSVLKWIFIITNSFGLLLNAIDFAYFPFTQKRTTYDVVNLTIGGQSNITQLIPVFLMDYWYVVILLVLSIWALIKLYKQTLKSANHTSLPFTFKRFSLYFISFILTTGLTVLAIRGGLQRVPIMLIDAASYTKPQYIPILLNTPFSIIKTKESEKLETLDFLPKQDLITYVNPRHQSDTGAFKNTNVCVIILEGFSKEYTGLSNRKSYTPFLDSLTKQSLVFTNAFSNGKTSIEGIPSILASMPSFMSNPYINSNYSNNTIEALPSLLKHNKYYSAFFHGGTNGTMNFDAFASMAGFDDYFGRTEYNNDEDYDGHWGIWDEPFLQYMVKKVSQFKQPFFTTVFTLSSHNPFKVPAKFANKFNKGTLEIHESVGYADYALQHFFNEAKKQAWFKNTLFVLVPDHTALSDDAFYVNSLGQYTIPIMLYKENELSGISNKIVEQIDIMPTILDYLNYDKPYYALGQSMFSTQAKPSLHYMNNNYTLTTDSLFFMFNNFSISGVYNYKKDSTLSQSILGLYKTQEDYFLNYTKAFAQTYSNDLNKNTTHYIK